MKVDDKYNFCYNHYNTSKSTDVKSGQWHSDETVDQLMKLNANCGKMAISLAKIASFMEWEQARNTDKEQKGMLRTKEALNTDDEEEIEEEDL